MEQRGEDLRALDQARAGSIEVGVAVRRRSRAARADGMERAPFRAVPYVDRARAWFARSETRTASARRRRADGDARTSQSTTPLRAPSVGKRIAATGRPYELRRPVRRQHQRVEPLDAGDRRPRQSFGDRASDARRSVMRSDQRASPRSPIERGRDPRDDRPRRRRSVLGASDTIARRFRASPAPPPRPRRRRPAQTSHWCCVTMTSGPKRGQTCDVDLVDTEPVGDETRGRRRRSRRSRAWTSSFGRVTAGSPRTTGGIVALVRDADQRLTGAERAHDLRSAHSSETMRTAFSDDRSAAAVGARSWCRRSRRSARRRTRTCRLRASTSSSRFRTGTAT